MEYKEEGVLIQVITKEEVENMIMKENSLQFALLYSSPILEDDLYEALGPLGEGSLVKDIIGI